MRFQLQESSTKEFVLHPSIQEESREEVGTFSLFMEVTKIKSDNKNQISVGLLRIRLDQEQDFFVVVINSSVMCLFLKKSYTCTAFDNSKKKKGGCLNRIL